MLKRLVHSTLRGTLVPGIRARATEVWTRRRQAAEWQRKTKALDRWLARLGAQRPDVIIGANLAWGGVRQHIHALRDYSALRLEPAPPDELLEDFGPELQSLFAQFVPLGARAIHSHVFPWFIQWCRQRQGSGPRWLHTYHLNYFPEHARTELQPWQRAINAALLGEARLADIRISVSRWQRDFLARTHQIETIYLPNGVDVAECDRGQAGRFRSRFSDRPFLLYVGRNDPVKNPADFVRLAQRLPGQACVMIGHGLSPEILRTEWLVQLPDNLEVRGDATHGEVQDALAACAALVVTSKREGLPTLVLEAMTHGKPIVVPDEAGCKEAIHDGEFGFIYQPDQLDHLADQAQAALKDKQKPRGSRDRVLSHYDWRVVAPQLDELYRGGGEGL